MAATTGVAADLGLPITGARVLHNSNKVAVHLVPSDVVARVAPAGQEVAQFEIDVARQLRAAGSPVAALDPRVPAQPLARDGFIVTFWSYYDPLPQGHDFAAEYAAAIEKLHGGMRTVSVASPHFTDRIAEAERAIETSMDPLLTADDRGLLRSSLRERRRAIIGRGAAEQLLHGEPHPGNVLRTRDGLRFIDFETCCRGPVEFDLAHVPDDVSDCYPEVDSDLLGECRGLVLAMVAAWRFEPADQFPRRQEAARLLLAALRRGPPWPTLDTLMSAEL